MSSILSPYFEFPIGIIDRGDVVFTDASANTATPPNFHFDPSRLAQLDWQAIDSKKWSAADDAQRHRRMAEVLVHGALPLEEAARVVVWNSDAERRVREIVAEAGEAGAKFPPISFQAPFDRPHWFTVFAEEDRKGQSIVTGPRGLAIECEDAWRQIEECVNEATSPKFDSLPALLVGLRADFGCLPQTAELVGLKSENGLHKRTVDVHTLEVVERLRALPEFVNLPETSQVVVEVAAYLHDIGKGPKKRWELNGGVQKVDDDHPVKAMPMLVDIFSNYVRSFAVEDVQLIIKLVCYHDLVGEVMGKGRDEQQIVDVAKSTLELDLLFMLGKADATSLREEWWDAMKANSLYNRCREAIT